MRSRIALWFWLRRHPGSRVEWHAAGTCTIVSGVGITLKLNRQTRAEAAAVALDAFRQYERLVSGVAAALHREAQGDEGSRR